MFKSILIPTDFSPTAWKTLRVGLELAHTYSSRVSMLHVYPASIEIDETTSKITLDHMENLRTNMVKIVNELTEGRSLEVTNLVVSGNVKETLLDFVGRHDYDLIIMGVNSHGTNNQPGTHTLSVFESSVSPVLVIPNKYLMND